MGLKGLFFGREYGIAKGAKAVIRFFQTALPILGMMSGIIHLTI